MASRYQLVAEYSDDPEADDLATAPHWCLAVVRLAKPLSYSRQSKGSASLDPADGVRMRGGEVLVVADDCLQLNVVGDKSSHLAQLSATLVQTDTNYFNEILPGDWVLAWIVHSRDALLDLIRRIRAGDACNSFKDGFKFVGRAESIPKQSSRDPRSGSRTTRYALSAYGFRELDTSVFYDHFLASNSVESQNLGRWLARIGLDIQDLFAVEARELRDNVHLLIPALLQLLVGKGPDPAVNDTADPALRAFTGGGPAGSPTSLDVVSGVGDTEQPREAPFAYLVPQEVGALLGKQSRDASKAGGILAYADLLEVVFGVQKYAGAAQNSYDGFAPELALDDPLSKGNHKYTGNPMLGAFLPDFPDFSNHALWSVLQQYLNPELNEMYTALRVNERGSVVPTLVLRQIPLTTPGLAAKLDRGQASGGPPGGALDAISGGDAGQAPPTPYTGYYDLPRWVLPAAMWRSEQLVRSDARRCNFVHVYGQAADEAINKEITYQLVNNPPVRDDLDIQRSGLHAHMATVACRAINEVGSTPGQWMELIADREMGAQWLTSGSIEAMGIREPICPGDNLETEDGVLYHLERVEHACACDPGGTGRTWSTVLTVSNGMLASGDTVDDYPEYVGLTTQDAADFDAVATIDGLDDGRQRPAPEAPFDPKGKANQ